MFVFKPTVKCLTHLKTKYNTQNLAVLNLSSVVFVSLMLNLTACQTLPQSPNTTAQPTNQVINFNITGKIGISTPTQTGSAFYAWVQQDKRFAIDLTGALGIGHTYIEGTGSTNRLINEKTGTLTADTPEKLLYTATQWQAPISVLPHWIMAQPAPKQTQQTRDNLGRMLTATADNWSVKFSYHGEQHLPKKLSLTNGNNRVILTIFHQQ